MKLNYFLMQLHHNKIYILPWNICPIYKYQDSQEDVGGRSSMAKTVKTFRYPGIHHLISYFIKLGTKTNQGVL